MAYSHKIVIALIIIAVGLSLFAFAAIFNIGGIGKTLSGVGGPAATGLYRLAANIPKFALSGGWPQMGVFLLLSYLVFPLLVALAVWHYDLPYKITGAAQPSSTGDYTNTMNREPTEPERSPTAKS